MIFSPKVEHLKSTWNFKIAVTRWPILRRPTKPMFASFDDRIIYELVLVDTWDATAIKTLI